MDALLTSGEAAAELGTSVPRVLRAARSGLVPTTRRGNRTMFSRDAVAQLRRRWGWTPRIPGFSNAELRVLAALGRRPFGLVSAKAVARQAGLSPTATGRALRRLTDRGLVTNAPARVAESVVRDLLVWKIIWGSAEWARLAPTVSRVQLPAIPSQGGRSGEVPMRLAHLFWSGDVRQLEIERDGVIVADRILRSEDPEALAWLATAVPADAVRAAATSRGLDHRRACLAQILADAE